MCNCKVCQGEKRKLQQEIAELRRRLAAKQSLVPLKKEKVLTGKTFYASIPFTEKVDLRKATP